MTTTGAAAGSGGTPPTVPHAPELRADAARNRAKVLAVARRMVAEGDTALPMNLIARDAGVGVGTVYRHFANRQVLLEHLAADSFTALLVHARAAAEEPDPHRGLARMLHAAVEQLLEDVALGAVLRAGDVTCAHTTVALTELLGTFTTVLDRARAAGAVREDVVPDDLRRYLLGAETAARLTDLGHGPDRARIARDLEMLVAGLRPARPGSASAPTGRR